MQKRLVQNFTFILEWGQGTCSLMKHTWRWAYSRYFFPACYLLRFAAFLVISYSSRSKDNSFHSGFSLCWCGGLCKDRVVDTFQTGGSYFSIVRLVYLSYHLWYFRLQNIIKENTSQAVPGALTRRLHVQRSSQTFLLVHYFLY